jgi:hypothetical protein
VDISRIYDRLYSTVDLPDGGLFRFLDLLSRPPTSVELLFSPYIHEPSVLHKVKERYKEHDLRDTRANDRVLVAINPIDGSKE